MSIKYQRYFDSHDVLQLLTLARIQTDRGKLWTSTNVSVWMQAVGKYHDGRRMVHRDKLRAAFPEVFKRLDMADEPGPPRRSHFDRMYVVEFDFGVKFGFSAAPRARLQTHIRDAANYGRQVGRIWLSPPCLQAWEHEAAMKARHGGREWLHGASFAEVVAELERIPDLFPGTVMTSEEVHALELA